MGNILKKFYSNSNIWIITSDFENIKKLDSNLQKKFNYLMEAFECRLIKYEIYKGSKKIKKHRHNITLLVNSNN